MIFSDGNIILTTHDCRSCQNGKVKEYTYQTCPKCNGTGKGTRGGRRGCKECHGSGDTYQATGRIKDCHWCKGTMQEPDDKCSKVPVEIWNQIPFSYKIVRQDRPGTFNEGYLGFGTLISVTDYGRAWDNPEGDADLLQKEKERVSKQTQLLNVWNEKDGLADSIVLVIHRDGYIMVARWN